MADESLMESRVIAEDLNDYVAPTETELELISLQAENESLKVENADLKTKNTLLTQEVADLLTLGDEVKSRIVTRILKDHTYTEYRATDEFDSAYEEAEKNLEHK